MSCFWSVSRWRDSAGDCIGTVSWEPVNPELRFGTVYEGVWVYRIGVTGELFLIRNVGSPELAFLKLAPTSVLWTRRSAPRSAAL